MTTLTINNINEFKNKVINIYCKQWEGNADVSGQAVITEFNEDERNPIKVSDATGEGHFLEYAIINEDGVICIGDEDRPVEVELSKDGMRTDRIIINDLIRTFNPANGYTTIPFEWVNKNGTIELAMKEGVLNSHYINIFSEIATKRGCKWYIDFVNRIIRLF